jgi:hypothetical protein
MSKISLGDLRALLAAEKADALSAMSASKLSEERSRALDYYLGDMSRDMPAPEGRSKAVSSDVADTIEGLMPTLMEIFCGGDEVVRFEPVGPEDVAAAEQEMHRDLYCCKGAAAVGARCGGRLSRAEPEEITYCRGLGLGILPVRGRKCPTFASSHDQHRVTDFDAGGAIDCAVNGHIDDIGERRLRWL